MGKEGREEGRGKQMEEEEGGRKEGGRRRGGGVDERLPSLIENDELHRTENGLPVV